MKHCASDTKFPATAHTTLGNPLRSVRKPERVRRNRARQSDAVHTLILDRDLPDSQQRIDGWLRERHKPTTAARAATLQANRFVALMVRGNHPPGSMGSSDLQTLLDGFDKSLRKLPRIASLKIDTHLAEPEQQRVEAWKSWLENGRPVETGPPACPQDSGTVAILQPHGRHQHPRLGSESLRGLLLDLRDRLLAECGIDAPVRASAAPGTSLPLVVAADSGAAGAARVEHSTAATVIISGRAVTAFTLTYVLPCKSSCVLTKITVLAASPDALTSIRSLEVTGTTIWWQGASRAAMDPLIAGIKDVLESTLGPGRLMDEVYQGDMAVPRELVAEYVASTCQKSTEDDKRARHQERALANARADLRRNEVGFKKARRTLANKQADWAASLSAVRASVERERSKSAELEAELRMMRKESAAAPTREQVPAELSPRVLDDLRGELRRQRCLAEDYADELDAARQELHIVASQRDGYAALLTKDAAPAIAQVPYPASLSELGGWANLRLGERVAVLPRALRAARKSNFGDPALVCRTLEALRDKYWPMRFEGSTRAKDEWERFLCAEHLRCGPIGVAVNAHTSRESYAVTWRGRRMVMNLHLQGHSGRDEVRQFRLYFLVDLETRTVVCGHLPSHLQNSMT